MMATPELITAPAEEPVSLAEARAHLRIDDDNTAFDTRIQVMIAAARQTAEHELGRKLIRQTWDFVLDAFPEDGESIRLPADLVKPHSIGHIKYVDTSGSLQTVNSSTYDLDRHNMPGYVFPVADAPWPSDVADSANAVSVRVLCGEWEAAANVPAAIKHWILMQVGTMYEHSKDQVVGVAVASLPNRFTDRLLDPYRSFAG